MMNEKLKRQLLNALAQALTDRQLFPSRRAALTVLRQPELLGGLAGLFPIRGRLSCARVAEICAPVLGDAPSQGWTQFSFDFIRARMFPQGGFVQDSQSYEEGALRFLTFLQVLLDRERQALPFDPMADFRFLPREEYEGCDRGAEYRRFLEAFRREFIYELMRLGDEVTPFRTLSHIAGVHYIAMTVARGLKDAGKEVDLALISAAAASHDLGKYGCRPGESVPHLHYYYTGYWLENRGLSAVSHIAANHSTWDLELDALSAEALCLIYADNRCKQRRENGREITTIYSLADAFQVILRKLENVDSTKLRRYELVNRRLRDLEEYMRSLGVDVDLTGERQTPTPKKDPALMDPEEAVACMVRMSVDHNLSLMHQLSSERKFGNIIESARSARDWKQLRAYLNIFEAYCTYLSARQKTQALAFLYELLVHREGDVRRQAGSLIGQIIARFHLVYRKRLPADAPSDPAEEVPFTLWEQYLEKIIYPDHKTTLQQRNHIGYALKLVVDAMLRYGRPETLERFMGALLRYYVAPEEKDENTAFTLLDAICSLPSQYYDEQARGRLIEFAAHFSLHGDTRLQTAALLFLRQAQRPLPQQHPQMRRIVGLARQKGEKESVTLKFLRYKILQRAGEDVARYQQLLYHHDVTGEVFLDNLKIATPWVNKVVGIELLKDQVEQGLMGHVLHISTHFSNLVKVSERVVVRHTAGQALVDILPHLRREQRNEVVVELGKGLEMGQYQISKYIPEYLGQAALYLHPNELDEQVLWLKTLLGAPSDSAVAGTLHTVGVLLQNYPAYRDRFPESQGRYTQRWHDLLGLLLQGLAHYRQAVRQEALLVVGQLLEGNKLSMEEKSKLFTLCCRKLLFLIRETPDQDRLTFFYRASALGHIDRFISLHRLSRGQFVFERPRKIAFFPGTFDPFTLSHKGIVHAIRDLGFEVYLAVDEFSWSKKPQPHLIRRQIVNLSVAGDFYVHLFPDDVPVNIANPMDLKRLRELFPGQRVYMVVGADVIANASSYKQDPRPWSIHSMDQIIFSRAGQAAVPSRQALGLTGDVIELRLPPHLEDISSTRIRENVDLNRDISNFIDPVIQDFIYQNGLYLRDTQDKPLLAAGEVEFEWVETPDEERLGRLTAAHPEWESMYAAIEKNRDCLLLIHMEQKIMGFASWRYLGTSELFSSLRDADLADRIRLRAAGKTLLITAVAWEEDGSHRDYAQLLLSEVLARALGKECVYAVCRPYGALTGEMEDLLLRQGFLRREGDAPLMETDMHAPTVLIQNLETTIQEPLGRNPQVLSAIRRGHRRLQHALAGLYPGSLVLTLSSDIIHHRLLKKITDFNRVPSTPIVPRTLGECMCVPFGKMLRGKTIPNTVTKTIHTDKVFEPDLRESTIEAFPYYASIPCQIRTIKSFNRPVILVDDLMHPGTRIRTLDPILRQEEVPIRTVLVGVLSGHGKDLMDSRSRPVDSAYFLPTLRQWFVESTLYPFIGGNTVRRPASPVPGLLPGVNHILPYAAPAFQDECSRQAIFALSRCCLESARDVILTLEREYRALYSRNLTLSRLPEAVILPLCPDKGECLHYDPNLAASVYLENDLEQLMRGAGL